MNEEQMMIAGTDEETALSITREKAAIECHERTMAKASIMIDSVMNYAAELKEIRDKKYYIELGFSDFESYTKKYYGLSYGQASKYISVYEKRGRELSEELFSPGRNIGVTKLYLLTTLDDKDREEILNETDIDMISKAELEKQIKELKEEKKKLEEESQVTFETLETYKQQASDAEKIKAEKDRIEKELAKAGKEKASLERKIKKLESAEPIKETVTVTDETEINRLKEELKKADKQISSLQTDLENAEKPDEVIKDEKELFKARLEPVIDGVKRLMAFIDEHNNSSDIAFYRDKLKAIRKLLGGEE